MFNYQYLINLIIINNFNKKNFSNCLKLIKFYFKKNMKKIIMIYIMNCYNKILRKKKINQKKIYFKKIIFKFHLLQCLNAMQ